METTLTKRLDRRLKTDTRRTQTVGTRVTPGEELELTSAAEGHGCNVSEWARDVLLREARSSTERAVFTELIATRMLLVNLLKPLVLGEKVSPAWVTEAMTMVRNEKHKAAEEVLQQYRKEA